MVLKNDFDFGIGGGPPGGNNAPQPHIDPVFRTLDLFNVCNFHLLLLLVWVYILRGRHHDYLLHLHSEGKVKKFEFYFDTFICI